MSTTFSAPIIAKQFLTDHIVELRCEKPDGFVYTAGQFVQFLIPTGETSTRRSYSLSSTPTDPYVEFCVKLLEGGIASKHVSNMAVGDLLQFRGPIGKFVTTPNEHGHYFVATGVGLAPIMGMITDLLQKGTKHPVRLLFGVRHEEDLFWIDRLDMLKAQSDLFEYTTTLSQPKPTGGWQGLKGRVTDHILHTFGKEQFYLCGSAGMVKDIRTLLLDHGVDTRDIHFEIF